MKILVFGGDGMLGHQLVASLSSRHEVETTLRAESDAYRKLKDYLPEASHFGITAQDSMSSRGVVEIVQPDVVINAVGVVKQRAEAHDVITSLEVNALFPHRLAAACQDVGARLIHISTDCVFSGRKGGYREDDFADADDLYGRSKYLGEVTGENCITLRTSMIGLELARKKSLLEWFLAQKQQIKGYRNAIFSGFTTLEIARIVDHVLSHNVGEHGLFHVSSAPIDKFTLLTDLRDRLNRNLQIVADDEFVCDRSLDSTRFRNTFEYTPPSWDSMLEELSDQVRERQK